MSRKMEITGGRANCRNRRFTWVYLWPRLRFHNYPWLGQTNFSCFWLVFWITVDWNRTEDKS